jgi:protein CpxP
MRGTKTARLPRRQAALVMRWVAASVLLVAAVAMAFSAQAQEHQGAAMGGHAGPGAPMMLFSGPPERVAHAVDRLLEGVNASDAQRSQIKQIAAAAAADLKPQREAMRGLHEQALQIFTAPSVDSAAAEALRQQMSAQHEQASRRTLQAMLDIANVLTPEQRATLGERMKKRHAMMQERMQRRHGERAGQPSATPK